jgi:hypothetical protein
MGEAVMAEVRRAMERWRGTHPRVSFAEIEQRERLGLTF